MSGREWKPGDVAMLPNHGGVMAVRAPGDCGVAGHRTVNGHWHYLTNAGGATWDSSGDREARPLVLIDPEDREAVERLMPPNWHRDFETIDWFQDHIRSLANPKPPKPEEPTGLGAVVEDADGDLWVRAGSDHGGQLLDNWRRTDGEGVGDWQPWSHIAVVRVLSEGVVLS